MARPFTDIDTERLNELAWEYITECLDASIEVPTTKGACKIKQRRIPTTRYFLYIWLRQKDFEFFGKSNWYIVLGDPEHPLHLHVKMINETFNAVVEDELANTGRAVFYAKNRLGMADKSEHREEKTIKNLTVNVVQSQLTQPSNLENESSIS